MFARTILIISAAFSLLACGGGGGGSSSGNAGGGTGMGGSAAVQATYFNAAKPLLDRYCVSCHHRGESAAAPFALESYKQVEGKLSAIAYTLESQTMPPQGYADLSDAERSLILDWIDDGAPRGNPDEEPVGIAAGFSYHQDIRAIVEKRCLDCHVEGGLAPFPLGTYDELRAVAAAAAYSIENLTMPPWPPTRGYTPFQYDRSLTEEERYAMLTWLRSSMPEGNPADYESPDEDKPPVQDFNLSLKMPQAYTPTLRPDDHRCFAIEWPLDEFTYVTGVDVIPDKVDEVHHVIVSIAEPEDADLYYAAGGEDGRPGWYCLGAGGVSGAPLPRQIGGWVPGAGREPAPPNTGTGVRPGSVMVVQMHYNTLVAEPSPDQSTILVATADEVPRPSRGFLFTNPGWLAEGGMPIPAGEPSVKHEFSIPTTILAAIFGDEIGLDPQEPWVLHQGFMHMHNLGTTGRTTLLRKDGTEQVLLDIRNWDFNWQTTYLFEDEVLIRPGDRLHMQCTWDNTQANQEFVNGEQLKVQDVQWGDGTQDEMCLISVLMTHPEEGRDYSYHPSVYLESPAYRQQFVPGDLVPLKLVLNNFTLHDPGDHDHSDMAGHDMGEHPDAGDDHGGVYEGHYHVYLNTDDDDADHLTAWDPLYYYELPADIEPGLHKLRVSLRGGDHHPLGVEHEVEIEVVADLAAERGSLVDVAEWQRLGAANDPFIEHRPDDSSCPPNSYYPEGQALEVETGLCDYLSLYQPSLEALAPGDTLHLVLWHGDLAFEEPATGHVAVTIAGETVWQQEVAIPAQANIYDVRIPIDFEAPAGSRVVYHLHNHGFNSWTLLQLEVER